MRPEVVHEELAAGRAVLPGDEAGHHDPVRGIIDHLEQAESARMAVLEPGVIGSVHLDELTHGLAARPGLAVPLAPPSCLPDPALDQPQTACRRVDGVQPDQVRITGQVLVEQRRPEPGEDRRLGSLDDLGA
jgi:hypothetical protein